MGVYIRNITKEQFIEDCNEMGVLIITEGISEIDLVRCGECKHRDPEDKKCDCGMFERQGCIFPVADDYFCKYGERRAE